MVEIHVDSSLTEACVVVKGMNNGIFLYSYTKKVTNNIGEYLAVCLGLWVLATTFRSPDGVIKTDSQFVVNQVNGVSETGQVWRNCQDKFRYYRDTIRDSLKINPGVKLIWIPREDNLAGVELERLRHRNQVKRVKLEVKDATRKN